MKFTTPEKRFGETVLPFEDHDGTKLALVALAAADALPGWTGDGVAAEHAIRGIRGVTLWVSKEEASAMVLTQALGYARAGQDGSFVRFSTDGATAAPVMGGAVDLRVVGDFLPGRMGAGSCTTWRSAPRATPSRRACRTRSRSGSASAPRSRWTGSISARSISASRPA